MKKISLCSLFIFSLIFISYSQFTFGQAKIELKNMEIDWGDVNYQVLLSEKIVFTNTGKDTLKISNVRAGCGCTTVPGYSENIAPGDTGYIGFDLNIKTYNGKVSKSISFTTNDPETPRVTYLLKCNVIRPFIITPRYISFDKLYVGEEGQSTTIIKNTSKFDAQIDSIEISLPLLKINLKAGDVIKAGESYSLVSSLTPAEKGHIRCNIKIYVTHPDEKVIDVSAYGRVIVRSKE